MKIHTIAAIAALAIGAMACTPSVTSRDTSGGDTRLTFGQSVDIATVGARVSALRARNGLTRPLGHSAALQAAAQAHADDMARTGNFGHTGSGGSTLTTRTRAANYSACFAAENIAYGQATVQQVFSDWMNSNGHRRNILAPQATQFGFASNGAYYVLVLGRSC
ncbi:CAP domain-containing protein [Gymnodinialimonas hymeniacidonis]|uniref:CAP domain-containing protein n=1 Tax=Gymnodinialimonas hymeniacidonis TaxID=3126508 RepID=UPI0034C5C7DF